MISNSSSNANPLFTMDYPPDPTPDYRKMCLKLIAYLDAWSVDSLTDDSPFITGIRAALAQPAPETLDQLAKAVIHLNSEDQALLISKMAEYANFSIPMQLEYIRQDPLLTSEGRTLMQLIGDYSEEQK